MKAGFYCTLIIISMVAISFSANAQVIDFQAGGTPVVFSRSTLTIQPSSKRLKAIEKEAEKRRKEAEEEKASDGENNEEDDDTLKAQRRSLQADVPRKNIRFSVDVYPAHYLQANRTLLPAPANTQTGILITYNPQDPGIYPQHENVGALDIIFIGNDATVLEVASETAPSDLKEEMIPEEPVRAILELQSGVANLYDIQPGDRVVHPIFNSNVQIIQ
jgi:uncharacterized membrane protein (UPF0127 family)